MVRSPFSLRRRMTEYGGMISSLGRRQAPIVSSTVIQHRVVRGTVEQESARLRTFIGRMEHRYECSSIEMEQAVASGGMRETAEVSRWLTALHFLRDLTALGGTTGIPMSSTR